MKSATVADLRNRFAAVSKWLLDGEAVTITKHGMPFATLSPVRKKRAVPPPLDRLARLQRIFPRGPVAGTAQEVIDYDRGDT